jgi:hypothetical protein
VRPFVSSAGGFIGQRGGGRGAQWVAGAGALAVCKGHAGHDGLARVLEGFGLGGGVLWVGSGEATTVGGLQREEGQRGGVRLRSSSSPPRFTARVGAEGAGLDRGGLHEHGYRLKTNGNSEAHSDLIFSDFLLTTCSIKCPQEFEFQIFENGHCGSSTYWTRVPELFLF